MRTLEQQLEKCKSSIAAHVARGGTRNSVRGMALEIRYDRLRLAAMESGAWRSFCEARDLAVSHAGFDLFA